MWLLIDADQNPATGWEGFDFIVNRLPAAEGNLRLERHTGGWSWQPEGTVPFRLEHNELHVAVPRAALGLPRETGALALDFKWLDHTCQTGDLMDCYVRGDAAPEGRFAFRYTAR